MAQLLSVALHGVNEHTRLYAARALRGRREQEPVPALIAALHDQSEGIRWLAGEALIHVGKGSVIPILEDLVRTPAGPSFYEEIGHVLTHLQVDELGHQLAPVIAACEHGTSTVEVPVQAERVLLAMSVPPRPA